MKKLPLISSIMIAYNNEKHIREAIESVLSQTYANHELIVVDDGSADLTGEIAKSFGDKVVYLYKKNGGISSARNAGVEMVAGDYVNFPDADDLCPSNRLERMYQEFKKEESLDVVFGHVKQFASQELTESQKSKLQISEEPVPGKFCGGMMIKKDSLQKVGRFNEELIVTDYFDWLCRASDLNLRTTTISDVVLMRRIHGNNFTIKSKKIYQEEYFWVIKQRLDRAKEKESQSKITNRV